MESRFGPFIKGVSYDGRAAAGRHFSPQGGERSPRSRKRPRSGPSGHDATGKTRGGLSPRAFTRLMFAPTVVVWIVGLVMTFCSTVEDIGRPTIFWRERELYVIVGPVVLGVGLILLMITVAFVNKINGKDIDKKQNVTLTPDPLLNSPIVGQDSHVVISHLSRSFSCTTARKHVNICPKCHYHWSYPTDLSIKIQSESEECDVFIRQTSETQSVSCPDDALGVFDYTPVPGDDDEPDYCEPIDKTSTGLPSTSIGPRQTPTPIGTDEVKDDVMTRVDHPTEAHVGKHKCGDVRVFGNDPTNNNFSFMDDDCGDAIPMLPKLSA